MEILHAAWIDALAKATHRHHADVRHAFAVLESTDTTYKHDLHLHSAIKYLYDATCMPMFILPMESRAKITDRHAMYTKASLKIVLSNKIHIRISSIEALGTRFLYPVYCRGENDIRNSYLPEDVNIKKADVHSAIILGM